MQWELSPVSNFTKLLWHLFLSCFLLDYILYRVCVWFPTVSKWQIMFRFACLHRVSPNILVDLRNVPSCHSMLECVHVTSCSHDCGRLTVQFVKFKAYISLIIQHQYQNLVTVLQLHGLPWNTTWLRHVSGFLRRASALNCSLVDKAFNPLIIQTEPRWSSLDFCSFFFFWPRN